MVLTPGLVEAAVGLEFANGSGIVQFFQSATGKHFIDWFNANCARKGAWAEKAIGAGTDEKQRFEQIWNNIPIIFDSSSINLLQFTALMSILVNEVGQALLPVTELCGTSQHPGLAYPFDSIPGLKSSYNNSSQGNKLAGDLFFDDENFWTAHGTRVGADLVRSNSTLKAQWNGTLYPRTIFPTAVEPNAGFIHQADFFKFRGRGFIQCTWRTNYKPIVQFVQGYTGDQAIILQYKNAWAGKDPNLVCTISSNDDWDALFQNTDLIIPSRAIALHSHSSGNYLQLSTDPTVLTATAMTPGSFYNMGRRINGGSAYAELFTERVVQLLNTLNYTGVAEVVTA
jgi:hypothetical protein